MDYATAASKFAQARNKARGKPLCNNTRLVVFEHFPHSNDTPDYAVKLHSTCVVVIHADGTYTLNAGGWRTVMTMARINSYSPANVYQEDFVWYLMYFNDAGERQSVEFYEGIRVDSEGRPIAPETEHPSGRSA